MSHTSVVFHRKVDELPNPMGTYYFDARQIVATHLATEILLHESTNMIVVPALPDGCGVFSIFLAQYISSCDRHFIICW